jgi:hypothetical protein
MTSTLLCIVSTAAALICAAGWYIEHRRRVAVLQRYGEVQDLNDAILQNYREVLTLNNDALRTIDQLTEALRSRIAQRIPPHTRMYVN